MNEFDYYKTRLKKGDRVEKKELMTGKSGLTGTEAEDWKYIEVEELKRAEGFI